jgi:hypothetical protein
MVTSITREAVRRQIEDRAKANGLVVVDVSPRRSIVVELNGWGFEMVPGSGGRYATRLNGRVAFGPAKWDECLRWLLEQPGAEVSHEEANDGPGFVSTKI